MTIATTLRPSKQRLVEAEILSRMARNGWHHVVV